MNEKSTRNTYLKTCTLDCFDWRSCRRRPSSCPWWCWLHQRWQPSHYLSESSRGHHSELPDKVTFGAFFFTIDGSLIYRTWVLIIFISHHSFIVLSWFHFFHSSPYSNILSFFFPFPSNLLFFYLFSAFLFFSSVQTFCFNSFIFLTSPFCL